MNLLIKQVKRSGRGFRSFNNYRLRILLAGGRRRETQSTTSIRARRPRFVAWPHYGLSVATCLPADGPSKGGPEATVRGAKADLVPTDANLLGDYADWAALEAACETFCAEVNARAHWVFLGRRSSSSTD